VNPFTKHPECPVPQPNYDPKAYHNFGPGKEVISGGKLNGYVLSRSELRAFGRNPSKWIRSKRKDSTESMRYGNLLDAMLLAPEYFKAAFVRRPDTYPSEGKKGEPPTEKPWSGNSTWCKNWMEGAAKANLTPFKVEDEESAMAAIRRLESDPDIARVLNHSTKQVFILVNYTDPNTGLVVPVKILVDIVPQSKPENDSLADLKTAADASGESWQRHVFAMGYHYQAAMYLDAYNACTGEDRQLFRHIVSESEEPFEPALRCLSSEFIELGRNEYQRDLELFCKCVVNDTWPGYKQESGSRLVLTGGWHLVESEPWMQTKAQARSFVIEPVMSPSESTAETEGELVP